MCFCGSITLAAKIKAKRKKDFIIDILSMSS